MTDFDVAIVGGGAIGLACAALLARDERTVILLERHARLGEEGSSHNSGVIHAGLYYTPGSLKALTCVEGRERLYARCKREGLGHKRVGKLVLASDESEIGPLAAIAERATQNGAGALRMLDARELRQLEPNLRAAAAIFSPESGIVDTHELLQSYRREAQRHGAEICIATTLEALAPRASGGFELRTRARDGEPGAFSAGWVVNAAGLAADRIAALCGLDVDALGYRLYPCKGDYFSLGARLRGIVQHLVYPLPVHAGLGVHLTLDLGGGLRAGPDTEYVPEPRYAVDPAKAAAFGAAVRRYLPEIRDEDLQPDYAGVRPKLQGPGQAVRDFVIEEASAHGAPGLINLLGIESPGITASEAIAERVAKLVL